MEPFFETPGSGGSGVGSGEWEAPSPLKKEALGFRAQGLRIQDLGSKVFWFKV